MADDIAASSTAQTTAVADTTAASTSATPATQATAADGQVATATEVQGPIPFDRHKTILDGAYKERDTFKQQLEEYQQKHGWAAQVNPEEFRQIQDWSTSYREDPIRWFSNTISELRQQYPHLAPALTSEAARILAGSRSFEPEPDIEPDIPVLDANGQQVSQAFSADKVKQLIQRAVQEAVNPVKQSLSDREAREEAMRETYEANSTADRLFAQAQTWHGFTDHKASVLKAMQSHEDWSIHDAYLHVLHTEIFPKLDQASQGKLLTHLQTQANGATVHPGAAATAAKPKFKNYGEAMAYYDKHPDEAAALNASR